MMNDKKKLRKAWTDALRSGKFTQSKRGRLICDTEHCCLGVAGELVKIDLTDERTACQKIQNAYGMNHSYGTFNVSVNGSNCLVDLNDNLISEGGMTFEQIADFIDSNPEGLFAEQ